MTEHSIEELKRQFHQAQNKAREASSAAHAAKQRLHEAEFKATGFEGCIAEFTSRGVTKRFVPKRMSKWGAFIEGPMIKKDGQLGERDLCCDPTEARNLGTFAALSEERAGE